MTVYTWEGKNSTGADVKGELEAKSIQAVYTLLRAQQITPIASKIKEKGKGLDKEIKLPGFGGKVKGKEVVIFTRQFATMIDSGLPIVQALQILAADQRNKAFKKVIQDVKESVESGETLANSLARHPKVFDDLFVNMVRAGEGGGILDNIFERLSIQLEKNMKLKREIRTAMIYPSIIIATAVIVTTILLVFVIPTFAEIFEGSGQELPLPTQFVIHLSEMFVNNFGLIACGILFFAWFIFGFSKTSSGKKIMHPLSLKLPIFGDIIRKISVARFTRTLGTMLTSGVPILDALSICAKTAGNIVVEQDIKNARVAIAEGKTMGEPLSESTVFPAMVTSMIKVGEATGALDAMLAKVADFYESEVDTAVANMKQLIEPIVILVLGVIVGGLVIAMYLPIFKLGEVV